MKQGILAVPFDQFFKLDSTGRTRDHHMKIVKARMYTGHTKVLLLEEGRGLLEWVG